MQTKVWVLLVAAFCAILGAIGQLLFKLSSSTITKNIFSWIGNIKLLAGIALYAVAMILFVWALKYGNLSVLYPIIATSYIWVALLSTIFLKEPFGFIKWIGIFFILLGIILIIK